MKEQRLGKPADGVAAQAEVTKQPNHGSDQHKPGAIKLVKSPTMAHFDCIVPRVIPSQRHVQAMLEAGFITDQEALRLARLRDKAE